MSAALTLSFDDGSFEVEGATHRIEAGLEHDVAMEAFAEHYNGGADHGNGYRWIYLDDLEFGGVSAAMSLCFLRGRLAEAHWSANLPDAELDEGWPTQASIEAEVAFVRRILATLSPKKEFTGRSIHAWGEVWSGVDEKAGIASSGVRYKAKG